MTDQQLDDLVPDDVPEPEAAPPEPAKPDWTDEDAEEARAFGWKAPDEWAGEKPVGYIDDPRRYVERANNFRPFKILREQQEKLKTDYEERFRRMEAVASRTLEQQRIHHERDLEAIRLAKLEAVETADRGRFEALEKQERSLVPPPKFDPPPQAPQEHPDVVAYRAANPWLDNPILRDAGARAIDMGGMTGKPVAEQLRYAEEQVRKAFPQAFAPVPSAQAQPARPAVQRVDGGGLAGAGKAGAFASLPGEAKSAFKRFVDQGIFQDTETDRKAYANDYLNS